MSNDNKSGKMQKLWLSDLVGIAETSNPTASSHVKEILTAEIDSRSGWTSKPPLIENDDLFPIKTEMNETDYLLSSSANAKELFESIAELEAGYSVERELIE